MRIFKADVGCRMSDDKKATSSVIRHLSSVILLFCLSGCYSTIEYYKRFEGYGSEKINSGVNEALDCEGKNKNKSYCDDSTTNREKNYRGPAQQLPNTIDEEPPALPQSPQWKMDQQKPLKQPEGSKPLIIEPLEATPLAAPKEKPVEESVKKSEAKKPAMKKKAKKPVKKKPAAKKAVPKKKLEKKPKEVTGSGAAPGVVPAVPEGAISDKPLLPRATDNMLEPDKITP